MKKRILAVLLSAAMCVGLLAGCGTGNKDTADDGQITLGRMGYLDRPEQFSDESL